MLCTENYTGPTDNSSTFKSMTLFKRMSSQPGAPQLRALASVSPIQYSMDRVSDGMKVSGFFKTDQASLRLELSKQKDCSAEYSCQLEEESSTGKEVVTSSSLMLQEETSPVNAHDTSLTSTVLMTLYSLIQGLDAKLAVMEKTSKRLEDKLNSVEKSSEHEVSNLKIEMIDRMHDLQNALQGKIYDLENSVQDTISSNFQTMEDKLCQLDSKLSNTDDDAFQEKLLDKIQTQIDVHFSKLQNVSERADENLTKAASILTSISFKDTNFQNNFIDRCQTVLDNVNKSVVELVTRGMNLTSTLENNLITLKDDIDLGWQRLENNSNKCVAETLTALKGFAPVLNLTLSSNGEPVSTESPITNQCTKNARLPNSLAVYPGAYTAEFPGLNIPILCDTVTDGGGWIIIQRRSTGDVDFYRNWDQYKNGFGTFDNDFWLGNEKIHTITRNGEYELRVELKYNGQSKYAHYDRFYLAGEDVNFALTVGSYTGTAGDDLNQHSGHEFTTFDRDNDVWGGGNCAEKYTGAWWFNNCLGSNLNGQWKARYSKGLRWGPFTSSNSASFSEMKIRRMDL